MDSGCKTSKTWQPINRCLDKNEHITFLVDFPEGGPELVCAMRSLFYLIWLYCMFFFPVDEIKIIRFDSQSFGVSLEKTPAEVVNCVTAAGANHEITP